MVFQPAIFRSYASFSDFKPSFATTKDRHTPQGTVDGSEILHQLIPRELSHYLQGLGPSQVVGLGISFSINSIINL